MLRALAMKLYQEANQLKKGTENVGELSNFVPHFTTPIYGQIDGVDVTLIAEGNISGFSAGSWCVDAEHENAWVPTSRLLITDERFDPSLRLTTK